MRFSVYSREAPSGGMLVYIRRILKFLVVVAGVLILFLTALSAVLRIPDVQTFIINRITSSLLTEIQSTISVGRFEFSFFNRLKISDLLIKGHNNDTLIYAGNVTAGIRRIDFRDNIIKLGKVEVTRPVVAFITDSAGLMNLNWYLDLLKASGDPVKPGKNTKLNLTINQIVLADGRFSLINRSVPPSNPMLDFNNLNLRGINGTLGSFEIRNDTVFFDIDGLTFSELQGFVVKDMKTSASVSGQYISFSPLFIKCDSSIINAANASLLADTTGSFSNFIDEVRLNIQLQKTLINTTDLQYFLPFIKDPGESLWLSGRITGKISELRGRDIIATFGKSSLLDCDFDFSGLPRIEDTFIFLAVNSLVTNSEDMRKLSGISRESITIPDFADNLGRITFDGNFTGFTTDFVTYGKIGTDIGSLRTDISLRPEGKNTLRFEGLLTGTNIDMGEITGNNEFFGKLSMWANVDGFSSAAKEFSGTLTGRADSIELNGYQYRNVTLNGTFTEKTWDGSINITDRNIKMDLLGMFNFREKLPEFNFTLNLVEADLFRLNFDKNDSTSAVSALVTANFKGNNIDNLEGEIKLINSTLRKFSNRLELYDFSVRAYTDENTPVIRLRTDFADADIKGYYNFATIGTLLKQTLSRLMPSQFPAEEGVKDPGTNNFNFNIDFKDTDEINKFFRTGILLADKSYLKGIVNSGDLIAIEGKSKLLSIKNNEFRDLAIEVKVTGETLSGDLRSSSLLLPLQTELKEITVDLDTRPDSLNFSIKWDNKEKILNKGDFRVFGSVKKPEVLHKRAILSINIEPSEIYTGNDLWKINGSAIVIDSNAVKVSRLYINNNENFYLVSGALSEDPSDTLSFEFKGLDLGPLNNIGNKTPKETDLPLDLKGIAGGKILLTNMYRNPMVESNITIEDFALLGSEYGNVFIASAWNNISKVADIEVRNNLRGRQMFNIGGVYDPESKKVDLGIEAERLPVDALNPLLSSFASDISGYASGRLKLSGELNGLILTGAVMAENASLRIDYLQTRYRLNDTIRFDKSGIRFNNIRLTDDRGNIATLAGTVTHKHFDDFAADLIINMKETQVLNTRPKDNELFYGTAYATGITTIKSGPDLISFNISARTASSTRFFISLNTGLSVSEYPYINFITPDTARTPDNEKLAKPFVPPVQTKLDINLDLEATPEAELQIILDLKAGDVMKAHGSGNLNLTYNPAGEFGIVGDYIIEDGDYLFTLGNILNKSFSVENGGRISFNGGIEDADIDIKAIYKLRARLFEILNDERFTERIPVECHLKLSGKLFNPVVGFDIYLPIADEETRTILRNVITTEEELSRQFLYLLVMNSFYAAGSPGTSGTSTSTAVSGTSAMAVTTTEMLFNQVSNWLSQISKDFDIGFNYRPGYKDINSQELQVALSTQLLNDRVIINSNFDVRGAENNPGQGNHLTGDFDLEYKLTERFRFRVFNRFNNPYTGKPFPSYTQGVGFFVKQDFNKFSDLFRKKDKSEMKREEEPTIPVQ